MDGWAEVFKEVSADLKTISCPDFCSYEHLKYVSLKSTFLHGKLYLAQFGDFKPRSMLRICKDGDTKMLKSGFDQTKPEKDNLQNKTISFRDKRYDSG